MHGISPAVGGWGGDKIGGVGRLLGFAEKPSITNGKKHVELDNTKKVISVILAPTDLCHPLVQDGVACGTNNMECSAQEPVGAHLPYSSEAAAPMVVGAGRSRYRPSPLIVNLDDLDAGRVRSANVRGAGKP